MFERFTDRARKVMALANQEALRFNCEYIGTEQILLGLVNEGLGVGATVLRNHNVDLRKVRLEVEKLVKRGPADTVTMGKLPQTPRAKKVLEYAIEEARGLNHTYVGTEHLLLGLLREGEGVAAQVLTNLGLNLDAVRREVMSLLRAPPEMASGWLIERALESLVLAKEVAVAEGNASRAAELLDEAEHLRAILRRTPDASGKSESAAEPRSEAAGVLCPDSSCGHLNEPMARFCSRCGRRLGE